MLLLLFSRNDGTVPVPITASIPMGGSGYPAPHGLMWKRKRFDQKVGDWVEEAAQTYRELTKDKPAVRTRAAKIVRPFVVEKTKFALVPKPETVDWAALMGDVAAANALLALYEKQKIEPLLDEEEQFLMMVA